MSASEKLEALDAATPLEKYEIDLFGVLPQIVAVVEAAEQHLDIEWKDFADLYYPEDGEDAMTPPNTNASHVKLGQALTALEEALP